jgi:hypothetical protein
VAVNSKDVSVKYNRSLAKKSTLTLMFNGVKAFTDDSLVRSRVVAKASRNEHLRNGEGHSDLLKRNG